MNIEYTELDKAIKLHREGNLTEAERIYQALLEVEPDNLYILHFYGLLLFQKQDFDLAAEFLNKAISQRPSDDIYIEILSVLAEIYSVKGLSDKALEYYSRILEIDSSNVLANFCLGNLYLKSDNFDKALDFYSVAAMSDPILPELYFNMGIICSKKRDGANAIRFYEIALSQKPDYVESYINLADMYNRSANYIKAIECNLKALELNPDLINTYINLGNAYADCCELEKAITIVKKGLELFPDNPLLLLVLSRVNMHKGNFEEGWEYFKLRRMLNENKALGPYLLDYNGDLKGKKVYVYRDTGFGDTIQFARYIPLLKEKGVEVLFSPQKELEQLFIQNNFDAQIVPEDISQKEIKYDYQINLTSLTYLFKSDQDNIPMREGYIKADPEKVEKYRDKYFNNDCFKVGMVWQTTNVSNKSIENEEFIFQFIQMPNVKVYSLVKENADHHLKNLSTKEEIVNLGVTFEDFSDTAAAIENLDLLISIDTSVAHLAGAMGKPVWILLPCYSNWRWLLDIASSPWYKSAKLFRQKIPDNWDEVLSQIIKNFNQ